MTLSVAGVCYLVAVILFLAALWPGGKDYRLELIGLAFFAAGHLVP